jgi:ATP-binding cassette subfamily B protein
MLREAPVLVLDEPTAGLDSVAARQVIQPLRRLMSGRTTIMITHDLSLAPDADRILVVDGGRLVETGTHAELVARGGAYARLAGPLPEMAITGTGTGRHRAEDTMILRQVPPQAPDETMILRLPLK